MDDTLTPKMRAAREVLERRLQGADQRLRGTGPKGQARCTVRLDRLAFVSSGFSLDAFQGLPGFRCSRNHRLKPRGPKTFLPYGRVACFRSTENGCQLCVEFDRQSPRLAPCRVMMTADEELGLRVGDILFVLELLPDARFVLVELAWDFGADSGVDGAYVRRHALFGKSRPRNVGKTPGYDSWGSRKGAKFVRSYLKKALHVHRVELQLNARWLRRHHVADIYDFTRLAELLPHCHILFASLDERKLAARLLETGLSVRKMQRVLEAVGELQADLWEALNYLRRDMELKNVRRFLIPLPENQVVQDALREWAAKWPKKRRWL